MLPEADLLDMVTEAHTILCSNRDDTHKYNDIILQRYCAAHGVDIVRMVPNTNIKDCNPLAKWRDDTQANYITSAAIGARVVIIENGIGTSVNGSTGVIKSFKYRQSTGAVMAIIVTLDSTNIDVEVRKSKYAHKCHEAQKLYVATFPMLLGYAITVHRSQGATISTPVIIHIKNCFAPGLAYVAYSRIKSKTTLTVVAEYCKPENFIPAPAWVP
jgi:ATP-dependent exoDNAse (exonuclease V) alpha subunit